MTEQDRAGQGMAGRSIADTARPLRRAVFLDRDGVINRNHDGDWVRSWEQIELLPGVLEALRRLAATDFQVVVVTNQSAVNRGLMTRKTLDDLHRRLCVLVAAHGGRIDRVYCCPHRPDEGCQCRKPAPGMLIHAAADLGLCLEDSFLVGDHLTDLVAARAAGCRPILVSGGRTPRAECARVAAQAGCPHLDGLPEAIARILMPQAASAVALG